MKSEKEQKKDYEMEKVFSLLHKLWVLRGKQERFWQFMSNIDTDIAHILDVKPKVWHKAELARKGEDTVILTPDIEFDMFYVENYQTIHALNTLIAKEESARLKG